MGLRSVIRGDVVGINISLFLIAIYAAYGFQRLVGIPMTPVSNVLPFILLGVGVDDMFVLASAFDRARDEASVEKRVARTMSSAGLSITLTSLTDLTAFALGTATSLNALRWFCASAALGILFDYILQISFFVGAMVLDAKRQEKKLRD